MHSLRTNVYAYDSNNLVVPSVNLVYSYKQEQVPHQATYDTKSIICVTHFRVKCQAGKENRDRKPYLSGTRLSGKIGDQLHEDDVEEAVDGHVAEDDGVGRGSQADGVSVSAEAGHHQSDEHQELDDR